MRLPALIATLLFAAGCGGGSGGGSSSTDTSDLTGVVWVLLGVEQATPSIQFAAKQVSGSAGCNRFSGSYTVDGDRMSFGPLATTQMACPPPADEVERMFLKALDGVTHWRVDSGKLVLSGSKTLRFGVASITGSWTVTSFRQGDAIKSTLLDTHVTATFGADDRLTGSAGCNDYDARYTTDRTTIQIATPKAGTRECAEPKGIMEQERAYLEALPDARSYELAGAQLTLLSAAGTIVATYQRG